MHARHCEARPLATVAVMQRPTTRHLRFDDAGLLGRDDESRDLVLDARVASGPVQALGFAGIHVIEPRFLDLLTESGAFSILDPYVRLAAAGERIDPYRVDDCWWMDLGRVEHLEAARQHFEGAGPR
jgi:MurNAc alpha-1-phosphate uridylyltransferase